MGSISDFLNNMDWWGLLTLLISAAAALLCITLHELSHGFVAWRLGDPTAKNAGRLTLNPIRHLDVVGLLDKAEAYPSSLSGGQKQRVAMGRSLVRNPNVFLMDEPLAHLDAKLRNSMRTELKKIQADLGSTCIYVTHDFLEAMALGDRIAIVKEGRIVQVGSGDEIYYLPCNKFVAQLMGEPQINIIAGKMMVNGSQRQFVINVLGQEVALPMPEDAPLFAKLDQLGEVSLEMGLRPQNIAYRFEPAEGYFKATVYSYESIGNKSVIVAECGGYQVRMIAPNGLHVDIDQAVYVKPDVGHAMFFDGQSENFVGRYAEADYRALANEEA